MADGVEKERVEFSFYIVVLSRAHMGLFGLGLLTEVISYFYFRLILLPVFALASNCYCKVIYYFHKFNMYHYLFI